MEFGIKKSADIKLTLEVQVQNYITRSRKTFSLHGCYVAYGSILLPIGCTERR